MYQECCIFYILLLAWLYTCSSICIMLSYASPTIWCQPLNNTIAAFELKSLLYLRLRPLCLTNVHIMCLQCLCFWQYEVLAWLSVWSEVQMICIWSADAIATSSSLVPVKSRMVVAVLCILQINVCMNRTSEGLLPAIIRHCLGSWITSQ